MIGKLETTKDGSQDTPLVSEFKLVMLGDSAVGKTSFVKKCPAVKTERKEFDSTEVEISTLKFSTSRGVCYFNIWDTLGDETPDELPEEFYKGADCAILMFDVTSRMTYKNVAGWFQTFIKYTEDARAVLVGNKVDDEENEKVKQRSIVFHRKKNLSYCPISVKASFQWEEPFMVLMRLLFRDISVTLTEKIPLNHHEIVMSGTRMKDIIEKLENSKMGIVDDDDF